MDARNNEAENEEEEENDDDGDGPSSDYDDDIQCISADNVEFKCNSGSPYIIHCSNICDGIAHCEDAYDEDPEMCLKRHRVIKCGEEGDDFECMFGDKLSTPCNTICNNIKDCEDGMDESPELCQGARPGAFPGAIPATGRPTRPTRPTRPSRPTQATQPTRTPSQPEVCRNQNDRFKCKDDSKTIACYDICNMEANCPDGSDEDASLCSERGVATNTFAVDAPNPTFTVDQCVGNAGRFQCEDQSTVPCYEICNGLPDCEDGSDEDADMCEARYRKGAEGSGLFALKNPPYPLS